MCEDHGYVQVGPGSDFLNSARLKTSKTGRRQGWPPSSMALLLRSESKWRFQGGWCGYFTSPEASVSDEPAERTSPLRHGGSSTLRVTQDASVSRSLGVPEEKASSEFETPRPPYSCGATTGLRTRYEVNRERVRTTVQSSSMMHTQPLLFP